MDNAIQPTMERLLATHSHAELAKYQDLVANVSADGVVLILLEPPIEQIWKLRLYPTEAEGSVALRAGLHGYLFEEYHPLEGTGEPLSPCRRPNITGYSGYVDNRLASSPEK